MEAWTKRAVLAACAAAVVRASPAPAPVAAPEPAITPPAILVPRLNEQTLGWFSSSTIAGGETVYAPWTFDADRTTYTASSSWFRRCAVGLDCTMYTACSNGFMVASGGAVSTSCGAGGAATASFCSYHILKSSLGASSARTWYWCDQPPLTGSTFYEQEPAQPTSSSSSTSTTTSSTTASTAPTSPARPGSSSPDPATPTPTSSQSSPPSSGGSSTNVGAIAGGVVGGVVVIALIGAGILYVLYRNKKGNNAAPSAPAGYAPPPGVSDATAYQANEAKPVGVQEGGYYNPQPYPQGPYDPHMAQYGTPPPQEPLAGPPPPMGTAQPMPQEMPTTR